ncbi:RlpA-like double-psi beta-barrel-protein domain-containing protein-containing protein [Mycena pura]|uniref:RlpA-like double-psi beta-barrel-protein domain-containing protein-containing protein n=1 Tax=Mycena pura TaxID=153505 RepID=A0AAD6Y412_9AGAR|nr:RlpA-like double-psi beta-barrel-protein domain-containing protein-containing protein [Mycena pura]
MMSRSIIAVLFAVFLCTMQLAVAAPLPQGDAAVADIEKRITHTGRGTWYHPSDGTGNCGFNDKDSSPVVAISQERYNDNNGANCNQWIQITNTANGKVAYGKTRDSCPSCDTSSLDMSPSLFEELAPLSVGVLKISWHFMNPDWSP